MPATLVGVAAFSAPELALLQRWLKVTHQRSANYHHLHLVEDPGLRASVQPLLLRYIRSAHADAVSYFRATFSKSLDPRNIAFVTAAQPLYPAACEELTLKGFFGEIISGLVAELYQPHNLSWLVPTFCFRFHEHIFTELKRAADTSRPPKRSPGRLGDDCIAFHFVDGVGIDRLLACEAKCTGKHDSGLVAAAHEKMSGESIRIIEIGRITQILADQNTPQATHWIALIDAFRDSIYFTDSARDDLIAYTYSQKPKLNPTWLRPNKPHPKYKATKRLAAAEVNIDDLTTFIKAIYTAAYP